MQAAAKMSGGEECVVDPWDATDIGESIERCGPVPRPGAFNASGGEVRNDLASQFDQLANSRLGCAFVESDFLFG